MHAKVEKLWTLEKQQLLEGADFYERRLATDAVIIIPYPCGVQDRAAALNGHCPARQWEAVELREQNVTWNGETALLSYHLTAWRDCCSEPLRAVCASTYLDDDGTWLRLSHEREPVAEASNVSVLSRPYGQVATLGAA